MDAAGLGVLAHSIFTRTYFRGEQPQMLDFVAQAASTTVRAPAWCVSLCEVGVQRGCTVLGWWERGTPARHLARASWRCTWVIVQPLLRLEVRMLRQVVVLQHRCSAAKMVCVVVWTGKHAALA